MRARARERASVAKGRIGSDGAAALDDGGDTGLRHMNGLGQPVLCDAHRRETVTEKFYGWLAEFSGRGQVIVLENERISAQTAEILRPIEFTGLPGVGRSGFYPHRAIAPSSSQPAPTQGEGEDAAEE